MPVRCGSCKSPYWDKGGGVQGLADEAARSAPKGADRVDVVTAAGTVVATAAVRSKHDPKTCRVRKCGMCAVGKGK